VVAPALERVTGPYGQVIVVPASCHGGTKSKFLHTSKHDGIKSPCVVFVDSDTKCWAMRGRVVKQVGLGGLPINARPQLVRAAGHSTLFRFDVMSKTDVLAKEAGKGMPMAGGTVQLASTKRLLTDLTGSVQPEGAIALHAKRPVGLLNMTVRPWSMGIVVSEPVNSWQPSPKASLSYFMVSTVERKAPSRRSPAQN